MDPETIRKAIEKKQFTDTLRAEFEHTLLDRVARYLDVIPHGIIPNAHFAGVSTECAALFRDGPFYGCIALAQTVAEALVEFIFQKNAQRASNDFRKNVSALGRRALISDELKVRLLRIWERRNDYHHRNPNVERNRQELEKLAREKAIFLPGGACGLFRSEPGEANSLH